MALVTAAAAKERVESLADFSDELVNDAVAEFEDILVRYTGRTYGTASVDETIIARPLPTTVVLNHCYVTEVTAITLDGTALDITDIDWTPAGVVSEIPWTDTDGEAVISYSYGEPSTPMAVRLCIEYVNRVLRAEDVGTGRDVLSMAFEGGSTRYVTPDWDKGRPTGWLEIDRGLNSLRIPAGFA